MTIYSACRCQFTPRGEWLESCRDLGLDPLGQHPGGQSGSGRLHGACQPREKISRRRSPDELYTEDLEPKIEEGHAELLPEHTETRLEKRCPLWLRFTHVLVRQKNIKRLGDDITTPIGGGCMVNIHYHR